MAHPAAEIAVDGSNSGFSGREYSHMTAETGAAGWRRDSGTGRRHDVQQALGESSTPDLLRGRHDDHAQALCEAALILANRGDAQAIVAVTRGGTTARRLSTLRPRAPIIAATERGDTARRLALYWGVVPLCIELGESLDEASARVGVHLVERGLVAAGATAVFVSISADLARGDANYLKIQRL